MDRDGRTDRVSEEREVEGREGGDDPLQISRMTAEGMGRQGSQPKCHAAAVQRRVLGMIRQSASSFPECVLEPVAIKESGFCEAAGKCVDRRRRGGRSAGASMMCCQI